MLDGNLEGIKKPSTAIKSIFLAGFVELEN